MSKNIGILDPEGKENNPLTDKPYSDKYRELVKFWSNLPVYSRAKEIISEIKKNQVILIVAETGSGKSVLIPKFTLHAYDYNAKIAMTLPKQMAAARAGEFAAETLDVKLGEEVGYKYKGSDPKFLSDKTKLLYVTDGTIVAKLLKDPKLMDYDCIIVDEVHERRVATDLLLFSLRETLRLRPEFKVILMSATINPEIFQNYYQEFKFKKIDVGGARSFPIESIFAKRDLEYKEVLEDSFKTLINILTYDDSTVSDISHDILCFITSSNEAFDMCKKLNSYIEKEKKGSTCKITCNGDIYCAELFSGLNDEKQKLALDKNLYKKDKYTRKVIFSTNVAESSLTVDGIKFVIDPGYELRSGYDPENKARTLDRILTTQAQARQRMGRAGRTEAGVCYHMYTKDTFENKMEKFPLPDIRRNDITGECLQLLDNDNIQTVEKLTKTLTEFIEPPKEDYIRNSITSLMRLGLIENNVITKLGHLINDIPYNNIFGSIAIVFGNIYNCSREVIKILSMIEASKGNMTDIFSVKEQVTSDEVNPQMSKQLQEKLDKARGKFYDKNGDHLSILKIYEKYDEQRKKHGKDYDKMKDWAYNHFLKLNTLQKAKDSFEKTKGQMYRVIKDKLNPKDYDIQYIDEINSMDLHSRILVCLLMGFRLNTAVKRNDGYNTQVVRDKNIKLNRYSFLTLKGELPKNVMYNELFISMGKSELAIVSELSKTITKLFE
ncbi:HrpA-like RNA helicase [Klosneuvirus KNV1]|uniref:HrpA-like RNA helicase n=1 Tax=Klosneuvirus KNV1 TaxID=1977640 RepID=A0A1V0SIV3_9VIRU|nr:HrpA-like RNA helicase [Klosneuvirus KNV1]